MNHNYNLSSNQADRIRFDEMIERATVMMLKAISDEEAIQQDAAEYAELVWESTEIDIEHENITVDDIEEAKARTLDIATKAVRQYQAELQGK